MDIYKTFCPITAEYTYFSSAHGTLIKIDSILAIKPTSINLKEFQSYRVCSPAPVESNYKPTRN